MLLFSATFKPELQQFVEMLMVSCFRIDINSEIKIGSNIKLFWRKTLSDDHKFEILT